MRDRILLAGGSEKGCGLLQSLMPPGPLGQTRLALGGAEARRAFAEGEWDAVVLNAPLGDESGIELAIEMAHHSASAVLMLVRADAADAVAARLRDDGVLVIPKPVMKPLFDQALGFALATRGRLKSMRAEQQRLEKKLSELREISRAKCLLIERKGMTEDQAHRYLEKMAMDTRQTRMAVAGEVIRRLET